MTVEDEIREDVAYLLSFKSYEEVRAILLDILSTAKPRTETMAEYFDRTKNEKQRSLRKLGGK